MKFMEKIAVFSLYIVANFYQILLLFSMAWGIATNHDCCENCIISSVILIKLINRCFTVVIL